MTSTTPNISLLADQLIDSGALGRSRIYTALLKYLVQCAENGRLPKEMEIAIDVFDKGAEFDASRNSLVRVSIHQLRKKLERYYNRAGANLDYQLHIPKGQYTVEIINKNNGLPPSQTEEQANSKPITPLFFTALAACFLLILNLAYWVGRDMFISNRAEEINHPVWSSLFDDELPILVVMGDYYIFGELDDVGNIKRMVRDFSINSKNDLENLFNEQPDLGWRYEDLDLSYIPEGSAFALAKLLPILGTESDRTTVKMVSELTTQDIQTHHIIYVGYISALNQLQNIVFAASGLRLGENYDQLVLKKTSRVYTSDAGLPSFDKPFLDYGLLSTFPTTTETQLLIVAGMRDAGLIQLAQILSRNDRLEELSDSLAASPLVDTNAFEALYSVRGVDRTNFDAALEYSQYIDANLIWKESFTP